MEFHNKFQVTPRDTIFSTGVYLQAVEVEINGRKQWRWIAVGFEDDTFFNGQLVDIYDYADNFDDLFKNFDADV